MAHDPRRVLLADRLTAALSAAVQRGEPSTAVRRPPSKAISFSPELVRAILSGQKTETRRLIRPQPKRLPSIAKCPIAQPGDLLHVREPWAEQDGRIVYAADAPAGVRGFKPAMYMPRNASRLTLRVTAVRAEHLAALSAKAARAEGAPAEEADPIAWFARLWDRFFEKPGERWVDDPFVWVIGLKMVENP